jgi:hypothetical protein
MAEAYADQAKNSHREGDEVRASCAAALDTIRQVPPSYPAALNIHVLAAMLSASEVMERRSWGDYMTSDSLYSDDWTPENPRPALELLGSSRRIMVLGDPGYGKSTLLESFALRERDRSLVFRARFEDLGEAAEVSARTASFAKRSTLSWAAEVLVDAACALGLEISSTKRAVEAVTQSNNVLVLLDGLDEISNETRRSHARHVIKLLNDIPGRIVMASRVTAYRSPLGSFLKEIRIGPLDSSSREPFFRSWFDGKESRGLERALAAIKDPALASLAQVPVIAGFIARVAEAESPETTKQGLYHQYLKLFFRRPWKTSSIRSEAQVRERMALASEVAWTMANWPGESGDSANRWADHLFLDEIMDHPPVDRREKEWDRGVEGLLFEDGILTRHAEPAEAYSGIEIRWLHRTIHEHLAGRKLARLLKSDRTAALVRIKEAILRRHWAEPLQHLTGFLAKDGTAEAVIDFLWEESAHCDPGGRITAFIVDVVVASGNFQRSEEIHERLLRDSNLEVAAALDPSATFDHIQTMTIDPSDRYIASRICSATAHMTKTQAVAVLRKLVEMPGLRPADRIQVARHRIMADRELGMHAALDDLLIWKDHPLPEAIFARWDSEFMLTVVATLESNLDHHVCLTLVRVLQVMADSAIAEDRLKAHADTRSALANVCSGAGLLGEFLLFCFDFKGLTWFQNTFERTPEGDLLHARILSEETLPGLEFMMGRLSPHTPKRTTPWASAGAAARRYDRDQAPTDLTVWSDARVRSALLTAQSAVIADAADVEEFFHSAAWSVHNKNFKHASEYWSVFHRYDKAFPGSWRWDPGTAYAEEFRNRPWREQWSVFKECVQEFMIECSYKGGGATNKTLYAVQSEVFKWIGMRAENVYLPDELQLREPEQHHVRDLVSIVVEAASQSRAEKSQYLREQLAVLLFDRDLLHRHWTQLTKNP